MCWLVVFTLVRFLLGSVNLTQTEVIWRGGRSVEEFLLSDWPVDKMVGVGGPNLSLLWVVLCYPRKQAETSWST